MEALWIILTDVEDIVESLSGGGAWLITCVVVTLPSLCCYQMLKQPSRLRSSPQYRAPAPPHCTTRPLCRRLDCSEQLGSLGSANMKQPGVAESTSAQAAVTLCSYDHEMPLSHRAMFEWEVIRWGSEITFCSKRALIRSNTMRLDNEGSMTLPPRAAQA